MIEYEDEKGNFIAQVNGGRVPLVGETVLLSGVREKLAGWYAVNRIYTSVETMHGTDDEQTVHVVLLKGRK